MTTNIITLKDRPKIARKADCPREARVVPLNNPTTDVLLRSLGLDPTEWWVAQDRAQIDHALADIAKRAGRAMVQEVLLQKLEEYRP